MAHSAQAARAAFLHAAYTAAHATVGVELQVKDIIAPLGLTPEEIDSALQYGVDRQWYRPHFTWGRHQGFRLSLTAAGIDAAEQLQPQQYEAVPPRGGPQLAPAYPEQVWTSRARPSTTWRLGAGWTPRGAQPGESLGYGVTPLADPALDLPLELLAGAGMAAGMGARTLVVGLTGSGKTAGVMAPLLRTWLQAASVPAGLWLIDYTGELTDLATTGPVARAVQVLRPDGTHLLWPAQLEARGAQMLRDVLVHLLVPREGRDRAGGEIPDSFLGELRQHIAGALVDTLIQGPAAGARAEGPFTTHWDRLAQLAAAPIEGVLAQLPDPTGRFHTLGLEPRVTAELEIRRQLERLIALRAWAEPRDGAARGGRLLWEGPAVGEVWVLDRATLTAAPWIAPLLLDLRLFHHDLRDAAEPAARPTRQVLLVDEAQQLGSDRLLRLFREGRKAALATVAALQGDLSREAPEGWSLLRQMASNATVQLEVRRWRGPAIGAEVAATVWGLRDGEATRRVVVTGPVTR